MLQIAEDGGIRVIVRAMRAFPDDAKVQAAGCWATAAFSSKDERVRALALEAGAKDVCLICFQTFAAQQRVRSNAQLALKMLSKKNVASAEQISLGDGSSSSSDDEEKAPWELQRQLAGEDNEECAVQ